MRIGSHYAYKQEGMTWTWSKKKFEKFKKFSNFVVFSNFGKQYLLNQWADFKKFFLQIVHSFIVFKNMLLIFKKKLAKFSKISKIWFSSPKNTKLATLQNSDHTAKNGLRIRNQRP